MKKTLKEYPKPNEYRSGCKVGFNIYFKKGDALLASKAAKHNASIMEQKGYDFGFRVPGTITEINNNKYEVVIP